MLGARIAILRRNIGMSQGELARQLQVSPSAIGMYEQGRREPSAEILVAMARIFGVTVDYLLTGLPSIAEKNAVHTAMESVLPDTAKQLDKRHNRPLSRQEVLFQDVLQKRNPLFPFPLHTPQLCYT